MIQKSYPVPWQPHTMNAVHILHYDSQVYELKYVSTVDGNIFRDSIGDLIDMDPVQSVAGNQITWKTWPA